MSGTITGSNPGWVAGYVPPAGEWNAVFSGKLDVTDPVLAGGPFLSLEGGTITGTLLLPTPAPTQANQAVPKSYVDSLTFAAGPFMPTTGGTFVGPVIHTSTLTLMGNPAGLLDAAPKQYVDAVGQTANSAVAVANAALRRAGDTMTGLLVLSADPVNALGAVTKQYADSKLPLAGGTITGSLVVNGNFQTNGQIFCSSTFLVNAYNGFEWAFSVDANGSKYQTYRTGWSDTWNASGGTRAWNAPGLNLMNLDGSGNLNVAGSFNANNVTGALVTSTGNASTAGSHHVGALEMGPWVFYNNGDQIQQHTTGWFDQWVTATGMRIWVGGNAQQMTLDAGGNLGVHGNLSAFQLFTSNAVTSGTGFLTAGNNMFFGQVDANRITQMQQNWYWQWEPANGILSWIGDLQPVQVFWQMRTSDRMCFNQIGVVGGLGAYNNFSDERAKVDIQPARCGLAEILQLEPIEFNRLGPSGRSNTRELGFSAQQVQRIIPLAVRPFGMILPDGTGGLEDESPSLGVAEGTLIAALVNGMKELAADVAALKAARTP